MGTSDSAGSVPGLVWLRLLIAYLTALAFLWIPGGIVIAAAVARTVLEDATLRAGLPGYAAYARRVRYRILPGLF